MDYFLCVVLVINGLTVDLADGAWLHCASQHCGLLAVRKALHQLWWKWGKIHKGPGQLPAYTGLNHLLSWSIIRPQCCCIISKVEQQFNEGQITKGTCVSTGACAIKTHSSHACLHKQRLLRLQESQRGGLEEGICAKKQQQHEE